MQTLDSGERVGFGQNLRELEERYSCTAVDSTSPVARKGIDKVINLKDVTLHFDSGKLREVEFTYPYQFTIPPTPYTESWKNFNDIGPARISGGMSRDDFLAYLGVWEERATSLGIVKVDLGDLTKTQYALSFNRDKFCDTISISIGPTRRAGGGGLWCDGWSLIFMTEFCCRHQAGRIGMLTSLSAFRDDFNTVARPVDYWFN